MAVEQKVGLQPNKSLQSDSRARRRRDPAWRSRRAGSHRKAMNCISSSIVAVLNGDQIGGRHPDTISLMGVIPPHRSSADLVDIALDANERLTKFVIDTTWVRADHPEGVYFRSDHLPYARRNIPALFFSGMLPDFYHTPADELPRVSLPKVTRMAKWLYETGYTVANLPQRPRLEPGFKLER